MTTVPPIPLAQQLLAWTLNALGYGDSASTKLAVSSSTLDNARRGRPLVRSWDDLVDSALRVLGVEADRDLRDRFRARLRTWDGQLGALPSADRLSLPERLHAPLVLLAPELGIRIGAAQALFADSTSTPLSDWAWLADPFDAGFFGKVVAALFRFRRPDLASAEAKRAELEASQIVDWRTVERWMSGDVDVPNAVHLAGLGAVFGGDSELLLRLARLGCVGRRDLVGWLGSELFGQWQTVVAIYAHVAAGLLASSEGTSALLGALAAAGDDNDVDPLLRATLTGDARRWSGQEQRAHLAASATSHATGDPLGRAVARAAHLRTVILVPPELERRIAASLDDGLRQAMSEGGWLRHVGNMWRVRSLVARIAVGEMVEIDGISLSATSQRQQAAKRWLATSLTFLQGPEAPLLVAELAAEIFGADRLAGFFESLSPVHVAAYANPDTERELDDDAVAASRVLASRRAQRLIQAGDVDGANRWLERARRDDGFGARSEAEDRLAILATVVHHALDPLQPLREDLRRYGRNPTLTQVRDQLLAAFDLGDEVIDGMLAQCTDESSLETSLTLVAAIPAAARLACARRDLGGPALAESSVALLVARLEVCLADRPTHGQGWAVIAMWKRLVDDTPAARHAEKLARHYGAGEFLAEQWARIEADLAPASGTAKTVGSGS